MKSIALFISGAIFLIVSAAHFYRYYKAIEILVGGFVIPVQWSLIGGIVTLVLALWMLNVARK